MKRVNKNIQKTVIHEGIITIDEDTHEVLVNDREINLLYKEYSILLYLIANKRKILTRDQLLDKIWGYDYYGDQRIVDTYIKKLRRKLAEASPYIQTVVKLGYMFEVKDDL
ncbi:MAG: winged helix-turn-helix domain-containing protein [Erysipelotrichaceae bacterium]|nr:winged helix-turn-helix domain-containing protein [Erysipelotrichaceae bacterium]